MIVSTRRTDLPSVSKPACSFKYHQCKWCVATSLLIGIYNFSVMEIILCSSQHTQF